MTAATKKDRILHVHVTPAMHRALKLLAAGADMTIQDWIREALARQVAATRFADEVTDTSTSATGRKHPPTPQHECAGGCGRMIGTHVEACWRCRTGTGGMNR